ncbi:MAG: T9SS type A sorting domain-containing protein [Calditrichaeota bacterium]|nr:T9SS type A sorting domain-containing protein [Calditrichota bacterium]
MSRVAIALIFASIAANAALIRVPQDAPTIQGAIDLAQVRDTVMIDSGRYVESVEVPSRGLTLCSSFILSGDTNDIQGCVWQGVNNGDDSLRCISSDAVSGNDPTLHIIGIRFVNSGTYFLDEGGAIRIFLQDAEIEHCRFDSCYAGYGGAIAVRLGSAVISNCTFSNCGQLRLASVLRVREGRVLMDTCVVENDTTFEDIFETPVLFWVQASNLTVRNTVFRNIGYYPYEWGGTFVYGSKPPDSVEFIGCEAYDNHIEVMVSDGGLPIRYLRIDSCHFHDNILTQALYDQSSFDSLTTFQAIGNVFESFAPYARAQMHGLFALDTASQNETRVEFNLVQDIHGGHTSFCSIFGNSHRQRTVKRNFILDNSNHSVTWPPSGQVLTLGDGDRELEENIFAGNIGYAVYQGPINATSYAQRNYWNHATGPYDSVGNPGGQGDTVEWRIQYEPWEEDTSFFESATEPRVTVEVPESFIENSYPNPFNGNVTIEFVVRRQQEIVLDIFDLTGQKVITLFSGRINAGVHVRVWQPETQASGVYFARLAGGDGAKSTAKLMYLK